MSERGGRLTTASLNPSHFEANGQGPLNRVKQTNVREESFGPGSPKVCQACSRIEIAEAYVAASRPRVFLGLFFVYAPIVFLPLVMLSGFLVHIHLRFM